MFSRAQYMNKECTHSEYYGQFVTDAVKQSVLFTIGKDAIVKSNNPHFNDIPLKKWDLLSFPVSSQKMKQAGDYLTLAGKVCIAKEAARQIKEENQ